VPGFEAMVRAEVTTIATRESPGTQIPWAANLLHQLSAIAHLAFSFVVI
jgi:hypothetical protein